MGSDRGTFLLTWTKGKGNWAVPREAVAATAAAGRCQHREWWNVRAHRKIRSGDRVFLYKQGEPPRGVIGSGRVDSEVKDYPHFDEARKARGETVKGVVVEFDHFVDPEIDVLPREKLDSPTLSRVNWSTQGSGIPIDDAAADELERLWAEWLAERRPPGQDTSKNYGMGGGESSEHKDLKERVQANPDLLGLRDLVGEAKTEFYLPSGDEVDVFVKVSGSPKFHAIEIKLSDPSEMERGVYQAIKYRALVAAQEGLALNSPEVVGHLVTTAALPARARSVAKMYGIRTHKLK